MSNHLLFKRIMSVMLVLALAFSFFPLSVFAEENTTAVSFSIDGTSYKVDMKFEGDLLYCRADQWAEAAGCLWVFNSDQQKLYFYYDGPTILASYDDQEYIPDGSNMWVPFFDAAAQTGVYFSEVSGFTVCGYRAKPLAVFYKDMDRMFGISKYRTTEMIIELGGVWALISSASRAYAILSSLSIEGFLDAVSGKMDQDMYDAVLLDMLKTDETLLGAITGIGETLDRPGKVISTLQKSLDEGGAFVKLLEQMGFSEYEIREIVWDLSQEVYGSKLLNDLADLYEFNQKTHFLDLLGLLDDMTISLEADAHTIMAMEKVLANSESMQISSATKKAIGLRTENKSIKAEAYLESLGDILWDNAIEKMGDVVKETADVKTLRKLGAKAFVWVLDKSLSMTETTNAIMYSDVYSQIQLELTSYYYRHRDDTTSDNALVMHSVALLYLRSCLAAWQMFEYDESLEQPISNATSTLTAEITNLMQYTEDELLQNGTREEIVQAIIDLVTKYPDLLKQEKQYTYFLQNHPEYNYYALLDINSDGAIEMLATEKLDNRNGVFLSTGENIDLYISKDGEITLAYEDIRSKYTYLAYDAANQRLVSSIGGSGGSGISYISLDKSLRVQETSFESYCFHVDENGNEIWTKYYNGIEVNDETRQKYENLYNSWKTSSSENIAFQAVPKAALIGTWNLFRGGIPHESGYWSDVWISSLKLKYDGTAEAMLGIEQGDVVLWYTGTWAAEPMEDGGFVLQLDVTGGYFDYEESIEQEEYSVCLQAEIDDDHLLLKRISGDDISLYYGESYERDLAFETWVERQGPIEDHITYNTLLWQYSEAAEYTLYDIDKDGCKELIIHESRPYNSGYYIYTQDDIGVRRCGDYYWSYSDCLYAYDGNGIVVHDGGTGSLRFEYITLYSLFNGELEEAACLLDTAEYTLTELYAYLDECEPIDDWLSVTDESLLDD